MSIAEPSSSTPAGYPSTLTENPDADFERRWTARTAWKARGLAHERAVPQLVVAIVAGAIALAAVIAYGLLSS